jgi:hypothetical protein
MKTAEVIRDLQQYQTVPYPFQRVSELQSWLDNELANSSEIQELYDLSTQVEPREREDEKMYLFYLRGVNLVHGYCRKVDSCETGKRGFISGFWRDTRFDCSPRCGRGYLSLSAGSL